MSDRTRGVTLTLLATDVVTQRASEKLGVPLYTPYRWAMAEHDGLLYVICDEGVGWPVHTTEPLVLELWKKIEDTISIFPTATATLNEDDVRDLITDETVDLADFIQTFGSRLEVNFRQWYRRLTTTED